VVLAMLMLRCRCCVRLCVLIMKVVSAKLCKCKQSAFVTASRGVSSVRLSPFVSSVLCSFRCFPCSDSDSDTTHNTTPHAHPHKSQRPRFRL
jgi:hypothetical protein